MKTIISVLGDKTAYIDTCLGLLCDIYLLASLLRKLFELD